MLFTLALSRTLLIFIQAISGHFSNTVETHLCLIPKGTGKIIVLQYIVSDIYWVEKKLYLMSVKAVEKMLWVFFFFIG